MSLPRDCPLHFYAGSYLPFGMVQVSTSEALASASYIVAVSGCLSQRVVPGRGSLWIAGLESGLHMYGRMAYGAFYSA
jgi:hypothetical protein